MKDFNLRHGEMYKKFGEQNMTWTSEKGKQVIELIGLPEGMNWGRNDRFKLDDKNGGRYCKLSHSEAADLINAHAMRWLVEWCKENYHGTSITRPISDDRVVVAVWDSYGTRRTFAPHTLTEALIEAILAVNK